MEVVDWRDFVFARRSSLRVGFSSAYKDRSPFASVPVEISSWLVFPLPVHVLFLCPNKLAGVGLN